jgi:hypothetical protein
VKSAPWANDRPFVTERVITGADFQPVVVTGGDLRDEDDSRQAWAELAKIGAKMAPTATPERQWALAFEDPKNISLATRVHKRPAATTFFPMPR